MTRRKDNVDYLVAARRPVTAGDKVLVDEVISFYSLPGEGRSFFVASTATGTGADLNETAKLSIIEPSDEITSKDLS